MRRPLHKIASIFLALALCGSFVVVAAAPASAATATTVRPGDLSPACFPYTNWYSSDDVSCAAGTTSFVTGPGAPPAGIGSAQLSTALSSDRSAIANLDPAYANVRFDALTTLQYSTYRSSVDAGNNLAVALQFDIDYDVTDSSHGFQGRAVFEPYNTFPGGVPQNTWQTWNALAGKWWGSSASPVKGNATVAQACPISAPCTLAQFLLAYPDAGMRAAPNNRILLKAGSSWPGFVGNVDNLTIGVNGVDQTYDFEPGCTTACYVDAALGNDANFGSASSPLKTIQKGIDSVSPGGSVFVRPGTYNETATNRTITASNGGPNGPHQFGLFVSRAQSGITIQGVTSGDVPITSAAGVQAHITTNATNNFGFSGTFIEGDNVTMRGLAIGRNIPGQNKTIEVIGNNFTLSASDVEDYNGGSVYIDDWAYNQGTQTPHVTSYNVLDNIFRHGVSLDIASGPGGGTNGGPVSGRVVTGNTFEGDTNPEGCSGCSTGQVYWPAISFDGAGTTVPWYVDPVGAATITGNTFGGSDQYIRHRHGAPDSAVFANWGSYWTANTFGHGAMATTDGNPANVVSYSYSSSYSYPQVERIGGTIQATHASGCAGNDCQGEFTHTPTGGVVLLSSGTFNEAVNIDRTVTVRGAQAGVDARTRSANESVLAPSPVAPAGRTPLEVSADDVTIDGVTVRDNTYVPLVGAGVYLAPGSHGTQFVNNIVRNNVVGLFLANDNGADPTLVQHNLFEDNTNPGSASGNDIYADNFTAGGAINGATIDANRFTNGSFVEDGWAVDLENTTTPTQFSNITVSNNSIDNHGRGVLLMGTDSSAVTGNTFTPGATSHYGVLLWDGSPTYSVTNSNISVDHNQLGCASSCTGAGTEILDPAATAISVNRNNLQGLAPGITSNATAVVDGTCNWWGAVSGPGVGAVAGGGPVTTTPWLTTSSLVGSCAGEGNPPSGTVTINGGAATTANRNVTLQFAATDDTGVSAYRFANGSDCSAASWVTVPATPVLTTNGSITVSAGAGTKTVCAQYRDDSGNVSTTATDSIDLILVVDVAAGARHSCARMSDGTAECWGNNANGQLGDGTTTARHTPVVVKNTAGSGPLTGVTQIATGSLHSCALLNDGTTRCWGANMNGQLGDGTTTNRSLPVIVKNAAGTAPLTGVTQVSLSAIYSCARMSDSTARCWGSNGGGNLGDGTTTNRLLPVTVKNAAGTAALAGVTQIAVRGIHSCARISDGTARCWGDNTDGKLGDGTTTSRHLPVTVLNPAGTASLTGVTALSLGTSHTCARISDGTARCWGLNSSGQLGDGTTTGRPLPVVVKNPAGTASLTGVTAVFAGGVDTCARISDGTARCWGGNASGQVGDGTTTARHLPVVVKNPAGTASLTGVVAVSPRDLHTCVPLTDGTALCWGSNVYGQLGDGTTTNRTLPVSVQFP